MFSFFLQFWGFEGDLARAKPRYAPNSGRNAFQKDFLEDISAQGNTSWRDSRESIRTIRANRVIFARISGEFEWFRRIGLMRYKNRGFKCEWFARIDSRESRCKSPMPNHPLEICEPPTLYSEPLQIKSGDLLMGRFREAVFKHAGRAEKQPISHQTGVYPYPLDQENPLFLGFSVLRGGLRPWSWKGPDCGVGVDPETVN